MTTELVVDHHSLSADAELPPKLPSESTERPSIWDTLPKVWLTGYALKAFDRRTAQPTKFSSPISVGLPDLRKGHSKELKKFAKRGGPDLCDLRGCRYRRPGHPKPIKPRNLPNTVAISPEMDFYTWCEDGPYPKGKTTAYDKNFEYFLTMNGIYGCLHYNPDHSTNPKPNNWDDIQQRLLTRRASLSQEQFSDHDFRAFAEADAQALNEGTLMTRSFSTIRGELNDRKFYHMYSFAFDNLDPLINANLVNAKPDFYDGAYPTEVPVQVRMKLDKDILPAKVKDAPCLPNFFTEGKGRTGNLTVARRQGLYDGALGARGIYKLQSFIAGGTAACDDNAYTISATYVDGSLALYTHHISGPGPEAPLGKLQCFTSQLGRWNIADDIETFRRGVSAFRNARDWAKEQRDKFIKSSHEVVSLPSARKRSISEVEDPSGAAEMPKSKRLQEDGNGRSRHS
ncbi:hypothetical protein FGG08_004402 [Glutinoglossum americanum]|uniref:Uncharacterized protein n=1 Tax=Glutinoglossum americanum TaxID=1670608 RepID=A0A9P8L2J7_9PEZI|nr:hypothetical protein FGG08_004402 [Glutinoglossum americanum]